MTLRLLVNRLMALGRAGRLDRELDNEVLAHLELSERDAIAAGLSPEEARRTARLRFGSIERVREDHRDRRSVRWIEILLKDVRYGLASLVREPGFSVIVIGVLALGIGANAAMFSLVDGVLLKPLPFPEPERIVKVWEAPRPGTTNSTTTPEYLDWKRLGTAFESLAAEHAISVTLTGSGEPIRLSGKAVTTDYFDVFATDALRGRVFAPGDDQPGAAPIVVLSHAAWQTYFGGDAGILDRQVVIDGLPHQVVGVMAVGAFDRDELALWTPLTFGPGPQSRQDHWLTVHGRLRDGTSLTQAREQMRAIDAALPRAAPASNPDRAIVVEPLDELLVGDSLRRSIIVGFGAALLVLLIACANVASLLLAKGAARRKELAVRAALGAGRGRLVAQLLTESLVLCAAGGATGLAVASVLLQAATPVLSASVPFTADVRLDPRVFAFTGIVVIGVTLMVGVLPALQTRFDNLARSLNQASRGSSGAHARVRRAVVIGEVALSLVLVAGAGLLFRSLLNLNELAPGVRIENIVTVTADLPANAYPTPESAARFYEAVTERLETVPGVARAALSTQVPLRWVTNGEALQMAGVEELVRVRFKRVSPGYFDAFDIPVLAGRGITERDLSRATPVAVINEALAARLAEVSGLEDPVGQRVQLTHPGYGGAANAASDFQIVGVIRNERVDAPWRPDPAVVYVPLAQVAAPSIKLIVRTDGDIAGVMPGIREAVRQVAPGLALGTIETMEQIREGTFSGTTRPAWVIGVFAVVAALLAALGLYGVLAHFVTERRREIGIRMALGADAGDVVRQILRSALSMVIVGLALGLVGTFALTRVMTSLLYEVSPLDPLALGSACAAMTCIGLLAGFLPASRAARVRPVTVLRDEG